MYTCLYHQICQAEAGNLYMNLNETNFGAPILQILVWKSRTQADDANYVNWMRVSKLGAIGMEIHQQSISSSAGIRPWKCAIFGSVIQDHIISVARAKVVFVHRAKYVSLLCSSHMHTWKLCQKLIFGTYCMRWLDHDCWGQALSEVAVTCACMSSNLKRSLSELVNMWCSPFWLLQCPSQNGLKMQAFGWSQGATELIDPSLLAMTFQRWKRSWDAFQPVCSLLVWWLNLCSSLAPPVLAEQMLQHPHLLRFQDLQWTNLCFEGNKIKLRRLLA